MKFRKRPIVIEAIRFTGSYENAEQIRQWSMNHVHFNSLGQLLVITPGGMMTATVGDWVIKERGEFYVCTPDIFADSYDPDE